MDNKDFTDDGDFLISGIPENYAEDIMIIAVAADPETWLPQILIGVPVDEEDGDGFEERIASLTLSPEEAYQIGAYLIQAASTVSSFYTELVDKTVEERKEIISLESQFLESPYHF